VYGVCRRGRGRVGSCLPACLRSLFSPCSLPSPTPQTACCRMEHLSAVQPGEGPGEGSVSDDDEEEEAVEHELEADGAAPSRAGAP
jgi:hypothetical protein